MNTEGLYPALATKLCQKDPFYAAMGESLLQFIESFALNFAQRPNRAVPHERWLGELFSHMQRASLPYEELAQIVVTFLVQQSDLRLVLRFLTVMEKRGLKIKDISTVDGLVATKLDALRQPGNSRSEREHQDYALRLVTYQRILHVLSNIASPSTMRALATKKGRLKTLQAQRQFQHILDRAHAAHVLPLAYRSISSDISPEQRTALIHQLAHQHSLDRTRSHRQVWRSLYYMYRHLQQHSLPIGPLFTKAIVRVSIVRQLSEDRFVSARRLIWVCQLVARVEGDEVAKKIENDFWHWRGDLIRHAKSVYVGVGGNGAGKAHVGTMKKLGLI